MSRESDVVWDRFDELVAGPMPSPWAVTADGTTVFVPDLSLLTELIAVPITAGSKIQSGLHAKAVDVWISRELRRAGFGVDEVWPRPSRPRVLPREVGLLLSSLPEDVRDDVARRMSGNPAGVVSADASVLGRAYNKQVDVVISQWARGPELLISSKRMHSSLSNNALNRIEESYGDAHNLRGRHPLAAIGYVLLIRGDAIRSSPSSAERLIDLVAKLGDDPAGYDATSVIVADWDEVYATDLGHRVTIEQADGYVPERLGIGSFLQVMVEAVLSRTPIDAHVRARELRAGVALAVREDESR